jgi:hypothetical protein
VYSILEVAFRNIFQTAFHGISEDHFNTNFFAAENRQTTTFNVAQCGEFASILVI